VDLVDQETLVDQQHHQHSNTAIKVSHTTDNTHHCEQSQLAALTQFTTLMSWASGGIITTKPKPATKASKHGHLNKIKCSKKQAKHQGGAGKARRGAKHQGGAGQAT
jgi:hypothetical protein